MARLGLPALVPVAAAACLAAAGAQCEPVVQHDALLAFWTAMNGPGWDPAWLWDVSDDNHCGWRGLQCSFGCVTRLDMNGALSSAGVHGSLPDVWGDLATLEWLEISGLQGNLVDGALPPSFAALQALTHVDLNYNTMTGSLAILEELGALQEVHLWLNSFSGPLPELSPTLRVVEFQANRLTGPIPATFGRLRRLARMRLDDNALSSTVPPELGALPPTTLIDLSGNENLGGVLPHTLLAHQNLLLDETLVTVGCPAGIRYNTSAFRCDAPCDAGYSTPAETYTGDCAACGPGSAAPDTGSACELCAPGQSSDEATNTECASCPAGTASEAGATACTLCGPGLFSPAAESSTCSMCPPGQFSSGVVNSECAPCPSGTASGAGSAECTPCGPGLVAPPVASLGTCLRCRLGTFSTGPANTECMLCPDGLVSPFLGASSCAPCGAGRVSIEGRACGNCPPGTSTEGETAVSVCTPCVAGTVAAEPASVLCEVCPPGTASNADATVCEPCPAGSTTDGAAGAAACTLCPTGSFAGAGNATCSLCAPGSFSASPGLAACTLCPAGTHQPEAGAVTECPACRYGRRCLEGNACTAGYAGAGCLFCAEDHFRLNNVCYRCPVVPWPLFVLLGLAAALLRAASKNRLGARQTTVLKILLFYVQMVVVVLALQVQWPATQTGFVEAMSFASAEIGLPMAECYVSVSWYTGYAWSLASPLAVVAVFWTATQVAEWRRRRTWHATEDADRDFALMGRASDLRRLWLATSAMMHLPLVRVLLTAFDCERDEDGDLVVDGSDNGTRCDTTTHVVVQSLSGAVLVMIGILLPVLSMVFVLWLRRVNRLDKGQVQAAWGALYESYRREYCFLEGVVAMRKVAVTLLLVVPGIPVGWRSLILLLQSIGWGGFVLVRRPYVRVRGRLLGVAQREDVLNELEVVSSTVVALHQGVAGLAAWTNDGVVWLEMGIVLLIVTVFVVLAAVWQTARIGRGFEVAPTGFSQSRAERDQQTLYRQYLRAVGRNDFHEAARIRTEGMRHARQTREFAEWRTTASKVSTNDAPFLEMVIAEETTTRPQLEAAIEAANGAAELVTLLGTAMATGHFDLMQQARKRLDTMEASTSSEAGTSSRPPNSLAEEGEQAARTPLSSAGRHVPGRKPAPLFLNSSERGRGKK